MLVDSLFPVVSVGYAFVNWIYVGKDEGERLNILSKRVLKGDPQRAWRFKTFSYLES